MKAVTSTLFFALAAVAFASPLPKDIAGSSGSIPGLQNSGYAAGLTTTGGSVAVTGPQGSGASGSAGLDGVFGSGALPAGLGSFSGGVNSKGQASLSGSLLGNNVGASFDPKNGGAVSASGPAGSGLNGYAGLNGAGASATAPGGAGSAAGSVSKDGAAYQLLGPGGINDQGFLKNPLTSS